jgi:hypothetical protein
MLVIARKVSSAPCSCERSIPADWTLESNNPQSALRQHRRGTGGAVAIPSDRVMMTALWSEVVSWSTASDRTDCVVEPRERHKSIVEGRPPFLGWCVGIDGSFWRWKLLSSSQSAMVWLAREIRAVCGRGPCHHGWCAFRSPMSRQLFGSLRVGRIAANGSARPGE